MQKNFKNMKLESDFDALLKILDISSSQEKAKECPFTFVRMACSIFDEESEIPSRVLFANTQECLSLLVDFCKAKELIVALTEELSRENDFTPLQKIDCLLPVFHKSLEAIPKQQHKFVNLVFNTICNFLEKISESNDDEKVLSCENKINYKLIETSNLIVESFCSFANKAAENFKKGKSESSKNEAEDMSIIVVRLMSHPFSNLPSVLINDEDYDESFQFKSLQIFSDLQNDLIKFQNNISQTDERRNRQYYKQLRLQSLKKDSKTSNCQLGAGESCDDLSMEDDVEPPFSWDLNSGLVTLSHYVFNNPNFINLLLPQVYTQQFLFKFHLKIIHSSIPSSCFSMDKSLSLMSSLLKRIGTGHLKQEFLDFEHFKPVVEKILMEVTSPSSKSIGRKSLDCLNIMIWAFSPPARLDFFTYLLFKNEHSGFLGFLITAIKSQLDESLNNQDGVFNDEVVNTFARYIFTLELPSETVKTSSSKRRSVNIHTNMDRYMASLNFLRFLVIRSAKAKDGEGGEANKSNFNISNLLPDVQDKFLRPLKQELAKSRSDLIEEMAVIRGEMEEEEESELKSEGRSELKAEIGVGGEVFGGMKPDEEMKLSQVMLVKLELIESILSRVELLIENHNTQLNPITPSDIKPVKT